MPRIFTSQAEPVDFCQRCFPSEATAREEYGDLGDGPDGRGNCFDYDTEHPPYDPGGGEDYYCQDCGDRLREEDDFPRGGLAYGQ